MRAVFFAFMISGTWVLTQLFAGQYEGRKWPVVTNVNITRIEAETDTSVRIWGEFFKERGACDFRDISFYLGTPSANAQAGVTFIEGAKVRGDDWEEFGPWVVQLTQSQFERNSYSIVKHQCHPFWITETQFR